jgi:hypothetical protein
VILLALGMGMSGYLAGASALAVSTNVVAVHSARSKVPGPHPTERPTATASPSNVASLEAILASVKKQQEAVEQRIQQLQQQSHSGGTVDVATMFQLQFQMQQMSQYMETMSNVLSAVHQEMMTVARAAKGQ